MYQFRSHTVSGIMLTLFISTTFAVILSFTLPALGIGTHYVYKEFFKVCWISHTIQTSTIKGLVYLVRCISFDYLLTSHFVINKNIYRII
uniref:Uncharacterized protein n=1 Tax=Ciona intestinalis TaxID=7719 RepID=H2XTH3_CIOIN